MWNSKPYAQKAPSISLNRIREALSFEVTINYQFICYITYSLSYFFFFQISLWIFQTEAIQVELFRIFHRRDSSLWKPRQLAFEPGNCWKPANNGVRWQCKKQERIIKECINNSKSTRSMYSRTDVRGYRWNPFTKKICGSAFVCAFFPKRDP